MAFLTTGFRAVMLTSAALILGSLGGQAQAEEKKCHLSTVASLPIQVENMRVKASVEINDHKTDLILDSGAFFSIMSKAEAVELGLKLAPLPPYFRMSGIGGAFGGQLGTADTFTILGHTFKSVKFVVGGSDVGDPIIGRNLLAVGDTEFDLAHGSVRLMKPQDCQKTTLAYWAGTNPFFIAEFEPGDTDGDDRFDIPIKLNGTTTISAALDTGAPTSLITRRAAEKAGVDLNGPNARPTSGIGGFGRNTSRGWIVQLDRLDIGDEGILKPNLMVIDGNMGEGPEAPDMLLGLDYILSHHMYFARGQKRIYFTYGGGTVFLPRNALRPDGTIQTAAQTAAALPDGAQRVKAVVESRAEPATAAQFVTRGKFRLTQRDFSGAIADLSKAVELEPAQADHYGDRALAYAQSGKVPLALADLNKAIMIEPNHVASLRFRAGLRFSQKDREGALADAEAAAKLTPPSSLDSLLSATLFEELGQPAKAIPIYDAMIALHKEDSRLPTLLNGRCWARALANVDLDQGRKDCDRAIKLDPANAAYLDSRGLVFFRQKAFARAIADYDQALKLSPKLAWSLYMRGLSKIVLGQKEAGEADQVAAKVLQADIAEEATRRGFGT